VLRPERFGPSHAGREGKSDRPKSASRKALIALAVRRETGVPLKWIAQRPKMGMTTGISRYANQARREIEADRRKTRMLEETLRFF
jgi:CO/xanthine dehydrogenase Mo-binding subunit